MPLFSIIIPCFNAQATLQSTLESLMAQTCSDWEAICVDDGSTDASQEVLEAAMERDPRIKVARNPGKGPSAARNYGAMSIATGQLIAFCDADDLWAPTKLASLATAFAEPSVQGAYGHVGFFKNEPSDASAYSTLPEGDLCIEMLLSENPVCTMSNVTVRRDIFEATGGFDTNMVHNEDLDWLIRLVGNGARIVGLPQLHTWYRASVGGLSSDLDAMRAGREKALATASLFGVAPSRKNNAVHLRYLARRALRLGHGRYTPLRLSVSGLAHSPVGFLFPLRRGGLTLAAALGTVILPRRLTNQLFSR